MKQRGRRPLATCAQREEVLRRVRAGESRRSVARAVFGEERLKGRVDRIIREAELGSRRAEAERLLAQLANEPAAQTEPDGDVPTLEELFPPYARALKRRLEDPDERVTAGELETFARLEYRLENKRRLERLNELTRKRPVQPSGDSA